MQDITISLTGANGDTIQLGSSDYILENEVSGLGRPPIKSRIDESASDGGIFRFSRRGVREIDLPVIITGDSRSDLETKLRRLAKILDDSTGVGTTITVSYNTGETWSIEGHYVNGATSQTGDNASSVFARWVLVFQCPQPFWVRDQAVSYSARLGGSGRGLFSPNSMVNMKVASSQILGDISIENPGDVACPARYILAGPFDSVSITSNGVGFTYQAPVAAGASITIDTQAGTVVDSTTGVNKYANLSTAPKFFSIPAGVSTIAMTAVNATTATLLQLNFQPRKEVVH